MNNRLQSYIQIEPPIYVQDAALPVTWKLRNVSDQAVYLFRDWFDLTHFRKLPEHPLSGFSLEIMRSNGQPVSDFVEVSGAIGDPGPLKLHHLYQLNPGETYQVNIDAFHFTVPDSETPFMWKTHQFHLLLPKKKEILKIWAHYTNSITSPSLGVDIWTGSIDSNIVEVQVLAADEVKKK